MLQIDTTTTTPTRLPWRPFALGFRPFFLLAGLAAPVLLGLWLAQWSGQLTPSAYYGPINWHAHEMLFGYTAAVIAGFLLTAVRNWTGVDTLTGMPLAALSAWWLLGRLLPFVPGAPGWLIAVVDLTFLPILALSLARPLFAGPNKINRVMLVFLTVMFVANLLVHAQALHLTANSARTGLYLMLDTILLLIVMITGRVLPFFTEAVVRGVSCYRNQGIEIATFISLLAMAGLDAAGQPHWAGIAAFVVAAIQLLRLGGWFKPGAAAIPILLVLYAAYAWLIAGFVMKGLSAYGVVPANLATHAFTVGGIGVITLGMMARVSLGHTGRLMRAAPLTNLAFILLNLAAAIRVLLPLAAPERYNLWIQLSGSLWIAAFLAFVWIYAPFLLRARVDGKAG